MTISLRISLIVIVTLFISVSCQNCIDTNCKVCTNPAICELCSTNYILVNQACSPCGDQISNCNVCNDTVLPLQCVSCSKGFYSNSDFTTCDTCSNLIKNCAQCSYQAPF